MIRFLKSHFSLTQDPDLYILTGFAIMTFQSHDPSPTSVLQKRPRRQGQSNKEQDPPCTTLSGPLIPEEPKFVTLSPSSLGYRQLSLREALRETLSRSVIYSLYPEQQADLGWRNAHREMGWHSWRIIAGWIDQWIHEQYLPKSRDQTSRSLPAQMDEDGGVCVLVFCHCNKLLEINNSQAWKVCAALQFQRPWVLDLVTVQVFAMGASGEGLFLRVIQSNKAGFLPQNPTF